jgi:alanyl-tRNA synthetase
MGEKTIQERRQALLDSITRLKESLREGAPNELCADHYRSEIKRLQETLKQLEEQENKEKEEVAKSRAAESEVEEETAKGKEAAKDSDDGFMKLSSNKKRKGGSDSETMGGIDEKKGRPSVDESDDAAGGQHAYELYSVLVHSGSATGGHYYAYIKSFERNKWYHQLAFASFQNLSITRSVQVRVQRQLRD